MKVKYLIEIKQHKIPFVLGLLEKMSFVNIYKITDEKIIEGSTNITLEKNNNQT